MRTKTRRVKPKPSKSIPPSNPSLISLPLLYQDEANEEYHVDGNDHGASEVTRSGQDNDNNNDDYDDEDEEGEEKDDGGGCAGDYDNVVIPDDDDQEEEDGGGADGNGDYDNVVIPDSVEEVDRRARGNHAAGPSGDCIAVDWLEGEFCISCNRGSGQVLVCSENGCPVAIHEACMNCEPKFDDMGKFYCPYCWYKRELARTKELRRKAMLAKKESSNFTCLKRDGGNDEKQEDETENMKAASVSTMAGKINSGDCENGLNDDGNETIHHNQEETPGVAVESISKEKSDEESISKTHGFDNVGDGERIEEEDIENPSDSEDDEIDEDRWRIQPSNRSHLEIVKDTLHLSTKVTSDIEGVLEENQGKRGKEDPVLPKVGTTMTLTRDATSEVPAIESFEFVSPGLDTETLVEHQKRVKQTAQRAQPKKIDSPKNPSFQPINSAKDKKMNQQGKATTEKNSVQCQESTKRIMIPILGTEKRRRLHWTSEEEDMLKEGVRRFATTPNKNIPWRKILEFGHHVFDTTRSPVDLKDKWKNIMAKGPKK